MQEEADFEPVVVEEVVSLAEQSGKRLNFPNQSQTEKEMKGRMKRKHQIHSAQTQPRVPC